MEWNLMKGNIIKATDTEELLLGSQISSIRQDPLKTHLCAVHMYILTMIVEKTFAWLSASSHN